MIACSDAAKPRSMPVASKHLVDAGKRPVVAPPPPPGEVSAPEPLGMLAGPGMHLVPPDLHFYGTDLGLAYEHDGELSMLFGDTWTYDRFLCDNYDPPNDDILARLPAIYPGGVPVLDFLVDPASPQDLQVIKPYRGSTVLGLGFGKVPMTVFVDHDRVFSIFARLDRTRCDANAAGGQRSCPEGLRCSDVLGECTPTSGALPVQCIAADGRGCIPGQDCMTSPTGFCFDATSSQYDGTELGQLASVAQNSEIGLQRPDDPASFDSVGSFASNKFENLTARAVARFTGQRDGNDYSLGDDALLIWGRPGFSSQPPREAQLYFMYLRLPLELDDNRQLDFRPQYYAGIDPKTGEPQWSDAENDAKPVALDGKPGGDPHESLNVVDQTAVSWLGAPVSSFVMLYGGDQVGELQATGTDALPDPTATGAIMLRFADQPWGPFTPPKPLIAPGDPTKPGDPYGPGGYLYHPACVDTASASCARTDPVRVTNIFLPGCPSSTSSTDQGRFYGVDIIDRYTQPTASGVDVYWNASIWNPYGVMLFKTHFAGRH